MSQVCCLAEVVHRGVSALPKVEESYGITPEDQIAAAQDLQLACAVVVQIRMLEEDSTDDSRSRVAKVCELLRITQTEDDSSLSFEGVFLGIVRLRQAKNYESLHEVRKTLGLGGTFCEIAEIEAGGKSDQSGAPAPVTQTPGSTSMLQRGHSSRRRRRQPSSSSPLNAPQAAAPTPLTAFNEIAEEFEKAARAGNWEFDGGVSQSETWT